MGRSSPHPTEIVGGIDDPPAEMVMPEAIDDRPPCQDVRAIDDPAGEGPPTASLVIRVSQSELCFQTSDTGKRSGLDGGGGLVDVAATQKMNGARRRRRAKRSVRLKLVGRRVDLLLGRKRRQLALCLFEQHE